MTKISYIHGIGNVDRSEFADRSALVPEQNFINYTALTDGELRVTLLADQANLLAAMYPENKELQRAKGMLVDALYRGLHTAPLPQGIFTGQLATVVSELRRAKKDTQPAVGQIFGRANGLGSGIGDPLIPYEICFRNILDGSEDPVCAKMNAIKKIFNENLEKSGHHILYKFVTNPNATTATVAAKSLNHRAVVATFSKITKVAESTMSMWVRNGIVRQNAIKKVGAVQPEATIKIMKENPSVSGIGVLPAIVIPLIQVIVAAIVATAGLVAALKQKDPQQSALFDQFQGLGTGVFGPEFQDWNQDGVIDQNDVPPDQTSGAGNDIAIPLLAAGAAFLLLK